MIKLSTGLLSVAGLGLLGWFTVGAFGPQQVEATVETHSVARRGFKVIVREKGELQAARSIDVICELEGRSTILWLIGEGTEVKEGDLLVELASDELRKELRAKVAAEMGKPLQPREIRFVTDLPKTRNAKVMRRIIRSAYLGEAPGDTSSLVNPQAVEEIRKAW